MASILTTTLVQTSTNATASDDKYNYNVNYKVDSGKNLNEVTLQVTDKTTNAYAGSASMSGTSKSVNAPCSSDMSLITTMLDAIIAEIKSDLTA